MATQAAVACMRIPLARLESETALFRAHWAEIALDKSVPLAINWPRYRELDAAGVLLCVGAFDEERMVGYSIGYLADHLHYDLLLYKNDAFFVLKEHRRGGAGASLRNETKRLASQMGAQQVAWHAKKGSDMETWLSRQPGVIVQDIIFTEKL